MNVVRSLSCSISQFVRKLFGEKERKKSQLFFFGYSNKGSVQGTLWPLGKKILWHFWMDNTCRTIIYSILLLRQHYLWLNIFLLIQVIIHLFALQLPCITPKYAASSLIHQLSRFSWFTRKNALKTPFKILFEKKKTDSETSLFA